MQIDAVSQNPMWAAMSAGAMQPGSSPQVSAPAVKADSDHDGDAQNGVAAVNDGDSDDRSSAAQQLQPTSGIDIKV